MNARRLPSGDHVGLESQSTLGDMYVIFFVRVSYTVTKLCSVRLLMKASFVPSGDQTGFVLVPQIRMNGFSPLSIAFVRGPCATGTR